MLLTLSLLFAPANANDPVTPPLELLPLPMPSCDRPTGSNDANLFHVCSARVPEVASALSEGGYKLGDIEVERRDNRVCTRVAMPAGTHPTGYDQHGTCVSWVLRQDGTGYVDDAVLRGGSTYKNTVMSITVARILAVTGQPVDPTVQVMSRCSPVTHGDGIITGQCGPFQVRE